MLGFFIAEELSETIAGSGESVSERNFVDPVEPIEYPHGSYVDKGRTEAYTGSHLNVGERRITCDTGFPWLAHWC